MFSRFQKMDRQGLAARLRFLISGRVWLRVDYDKLGQPANVAVGFTAPKDAKECTPEEMQAVQEQIDANRQAYAAQLQQQQQPAPQSGRADRKRGRRR